MKEVEFELNNWLVNVDLDCGEVNVCTNFKEDKGYCNSLRKFLEGVSNNRVSLLIEEERIADELFNAFRLLRYGGLSSTYGYPSYMIESVTDTISREGCCTLYTTNGNIQYDGSGRTVADKRGFEIIKIEKVKILKEKVDI